MRRDELCDPNLCTDREEGEERCNHCPQIKLDSAYQSGIGQLLKRALDLKALIQLGANVTLDEISGDEMYAMLIVDEEKERLERDRSEKQ